MEGHALMAKRPSHKQTHSWAIYHLTGTPAKFIGIVNDAADEAEAIQRAIEEHKLDPQMQQRLLAKRRD
jgi:hypothetical protein